MTACPFNITKLPDWDLAFSPPYDASAYPLMVMLFSNVCSWLSFLITTPSSDDDARYLSTCSPVFMLLGVACDVRRLSRLVWRVISGLV